MLSRGETVDGRPFSDPEHIDTDRRRLQQMVHQLVDTYDDPVVCDFGPGKRPICQSDPQGRTFRIYYVRPNLLFELTDITVVGFFGIKRPDADIRPLVRADKRFEEEFPRHPGLLSLSTVRLPDGNFANLVLFADTGAKDRWNGSPIHRDTVARISPPYYRSIRLSNGTLPDGVSDPKTLRLEKVKYIDYDDAGGWRAERSLVAS